MYLRLDRVEEAIADYDVASKINPKVVKSLYGKGLALIRKSNGAEGEAFVEAATAMEAGLADRVAKYGEFIVLVRPIWNVTICDAEYAAMRSLPSHLRDRFANLARKCREVLIILSVCSGMRAAGCSWFSNVRHCLQRRWKYP